MNEAHTAKLDEATRAKYRQDRQTPFLIHIEDGRLIPNTIGARGDPRAAGGLAVTRDANYVPYHGPLEADKKARLKWLKTANIGPRSKVINSADDSDEPPPVDIGKLTKDQLVSYALAEYGLHLNATSDIRSMRKAIMLAAGAPVPEAAESLG